MKLDEKTLAELEAVCANATPGPWEWENHAIVSPHCPVAFACHVPPENPEPVIFRFAFDDDFIATSREAMPALLAEVRRLRGLLKDTLCYAEQCGDWADPDHLNPLIRRAEAALRGEDGQS